MTIIPLTLHPRPRPTNYRPNYLMNTYKGFPTFYADSPASWREYLSKHHDELPNTWLILQKKGSPLPGPSYEEARAEALCYGWIDSKPNKRDDDSYYLFFARRNPKSNWSKVNKDVIAELEAADKMAAPGREMVRLAKETGTWDALNDVDNLVVPDDLAAAFAAAEGPARANWDVFPPSVQRGILEWIFNAIRPTTRQKRIEETATLAGRGERANQFTK